MRVAVMIALAALVAGCTTSNHNMPPAPADTPLLGLPHVDIPRPGVQPPGPGASVSDLERWISSARPVDPGPYHVARTGSGTPTNLGRDVAFTTPSGKIGCITDAHYKRFFDEMVAIKVFKADTEYTKAFTTKFVCKGKGMELKK